MGVEEKLKEEASNFANTVAEKVDSLEKEEPKKVETTKEEAAKVEEKTEVTATKEEPKKEAAKVEFNADVEVSGLDEFLIKWGFKEDPRIPEDCRVDPLTRIKESGRAGVVAYALTEGAFWIGSIPVAIATVAFTTGSLPDVSSPKARRLSQGMCLCSSISHASLSPHESHWRSLQLPGAMRISSRGFSLLTGLTCPTSVRLRSRHILAAGIVALHRMGLEDP